MSPDYTFILNKVKNKGVSNHFLNDFKVQKGTSKTIQDAHQHDYVQIWYVISGSFRHVLNGISYEQAAGDFIAIPPYFPHQVDTRESEKLEFFICNLAGNLNDIMQKGESKNSLFDLAYFRPLLFRESNDTPFIHLSGDIARQTEDTFYELLEEFNREANYSPLTIRSILIKLLTLVAREYSRTMPQQDRETFKNYRRSMQLALDYADKHFMENISLQDISQIALMSERSFLRVFREVIGTTFTAYIRHLRVQKAKQMLIKTNLSYANICYECGFFDLSHFIRTFKTDAKLTPGSFRKKHQYPLTYPTPNKTQNLGIIPRNTPFWEGYNFKQPFLAKIFELEGAPYPSIWELVSDKPNKRKDSILRYIKRGLVISNCDIDAVDVISGEIISNRTQCMTDGEYYWWSDLHYYFERYNIELPREFIEKIISTETEK
ncbi:MAG: helix-turn-helix transcriptional regulator [Clostridiales bacterium]|nr:helix-turn-helix transcriptional regulator [Clostridiales bacterium]